jgi:hypothetical protein
LFEKVFWQIVRQVNAFIQLPQYATPARDASARIEAPVRASDKLITPAGLASSVSSESASTAAMGDAAIAATGDAPHQVTTCNA